LDAIFADSLFLVELPVIPQKPQLLPQTGEIAEYRRIYRGRFFAWLRL